MTSQHAPEPQHGKATGRVEAFSDGVFAIAMTLLVLDLKVPVPAVLGNRPLGPALARQWPTFLAYLASFATILVMWVNHHRMLDHLRRSDGTFLFLNGLLLLFVTFVPFPTSLVSGYLLLPQAKTAAAIYAGTYVLLSIAFNLLWSYATAGGRLLWPDADLARVNAMTRQYRTGPALYVAALLLAFWSAPASFGLCLLFAVYWAFSGALSFFIARDRSPGG
jgi:TMEM175 potassium channel family protein